jgi:hypothetical protein
MKTQSPVDVSRIRARGILPFEMALRDSFATTGWLAHSEGFLSQK